MREGSTGIWWSATLLFDACAQCFAFAPSNFPVLYPIPTDRILSI